MSEIHNDWQLYSSGDFIEKLRKERDSWRVAAAKSDERVTSLQKRVESLETENDELRHEVESLRAEVATNGTKTDIDGRQVR